MSRQKKDKKATTKPLEVVKYGHPALRSKGRKIEKIDESILTLAEEMIETMYEEDGCGLAAHQVGRSVQLAVIDVMPAFEDRPSRAWVGGREIEVGSLMPLVMINPEIHAVGDERTIETEGCLSMPGLHNEVERPARVRVVCQDIDGSTLDFEAEGLLSRAAQHEVDHLHGILFIDYLSPETLAEHQPLLRKFQAKSFPF
ncbi:MAG: peptide deformylase [Verrucomicrobia bacterium]|nr:MAG: peptide deformylase [Verrucomicrobiota bacterium]